MRWHETIKTALEIAEKTRNLDLKQVILDLREALQDQRDENLRLREEVAVLRRARGVDDRVERDGVLVFLRPESPGGKREGPFCGTCYGQTGNLIPVSKAGGDNFKCAVHEYLKYIPPMIA